MVNAPSPFSETERQKFRNLLRMAAESPFDNERENARAAAERMAERNGMTLEEAASGGPPPAAAPAAARPTAAERAAASFVHMTDVFIRADKKRREQALREARARGLDADERERPTAPRPNRTQRQGGGRSPQAHARVLIQETRLPLQEVAIITGLDIYQVVGLKLKMRVAA